jgi:precorrin-2 dehydrogenase / sirohydrochlorin ferrochelatase
MSKYPIFLELAGRRVLIVGAGPVAQRKSLTLLEAGARVVIVAECVDPAFEAACATKKIELVKARYSKEYIGDATIVIAATNDRKVNGRIYRDCQEMEVLCNSVDEPEYCDFFAGAVVTRGRLQVAISTDGACPAYAGHLRKRLEDLITEDHGRFLNEMEAARGRVLAAIPDEKDRKAVMGRLVDDASFEVFVRQGAQEWRKYAEGIITSS